MNFNLPYQTLSELEKNFFSVISCRRLQLQKSLFKILLWQLNWDQKSDLLFCLLRHSSLRAPLVPKQGKSSFTFIPLPTWTIDSDTRDKSINHCAIWSFHSFTHCEARVRERRQSMLFFFFLPAIYLRDWYESVTDNEIPE